LSENYDAKILTLEREVENLNDQHEKNISEIQMRAEQQLNNLKQMYETERQKLE